LISGLADHKTPSSNQAQIRKMTSQLSMSGATMSIVQH
jgi:hypothetical protein